MNAHHHSRHLVLRVTVRYLSGRPLDGVRRTDSTFLRAGTVKADRMTHPHAWSYLPGWKRAAWRLGTPGLAAAMVAGDFLAHTATVAGVSTTAASGALYGSVRSVRAVRYRRHRNAYVHPLAAVLRGQLGYPETMPADRWLDVPLDFRSPDYSRDPAELDPDELTPYRRVARSVRRYRERRRVHPDGSPRLPGEVRVMLPVTMPDLPDWQRVIRQTVAGKLGIPSGDLDARYRMVGAEPYAVFRRAPRPPQRVTYRDARAAIQAASDSAPILGLGARDKWVSIDLDSDAPHVAVSCGSGAGKSVLIRAVIAQMLARGTQVVILDGKRISQSWCKDLAGVTYCRTGEEFHNALIDLRAEVDRRNTLIDSVSAEMEDTVNVGPRILIVFEEQNVGMQMLSEYWQSTKVQGDPKRSPAISALDYILCTGRQVRTHVMSVAQMFTVQSSGGNPAARENYGCRILARATRNAWLMLAPEVGPPFPKSSRIRGRMNVVLAGEPTEVQTVFLTVAEARELAASGATVTVPVTWSATTADQASNALQDAPPAASVTPPQPDRYTLAEAARVGVVDMSAGALRVAKHRAKDRWPTGTVCPDGRTRWTAEELQAAVTPTNSEDVAA